jgi:ABC-2 type transport system permease protein
VVPHLRLWFNPGRKESLHIVPGAIALVTWIFPALLSAFAMVREKEQGTILQLYASSITAFELILGKAIAYFCVGFAESVLVVIESMTVFGITFVGNPFAFLFCTVLYVASGVVFGIWAGSRATNQMAAMQICGMAGFLGSMLLSGFIYPIRNITYPVSLLSNIVAARYYMEASRDAFVRGGSVWAHWYIALALLLITLFFLTMGVAGMRKMQLSK